MHHDRTASRLDDPDLVEHGGRVGSDEHEQAVVELEHADGVGVGVADVLVADSMLASAGRDDRLSAHVDKLACEKSDDNRHARVRAARGFSGVAGDEESHRVIVAVPEVHVGTAERVRGLGVELVASSASSWRLASWSMVETRA